MNGRRMTARGQRALMGGLLLGLALAAPAAASAADARTDRYTILKDGDPIGTEDIRFEPQGDTLKVSVTTTTRVKVLFVNFRYDHKRDEVWRGGTLESVTATTDDDGTPHTLALARGKDGGYTLTVDGKTSALPATTLPLTLWTREVLKRPVLLSVIDGHPYQVRSDSVGSETVTTAGGQAIPTQHHRIGGEVERDLWFAADGRLVKTQFKRSGYDIVYLLK
ncbi:hypothetical protein M2352_001721 [Azospirillum fermentarium]|uniref:DUF6134 family protein n=1 Tax=Azospirillum fermentarium TaxID=1233114 RepID=UPI002226C920|nr:DUF6134 family protein [Azospirillum fermentarium]MCW2246130.1 hypothetical protein [Azospirillum fermentarium]